MNFSQALDFLKERKLVTRKNWDHLIPQHLGVWLPEFQPPNPVQVIMSNPFIYISWRDDEKSSWNIEPWTPDSEDLFADDWIVVDN